MTETDRTMSAFKKKLDGIHNSLDEGEYLAFVDGSDYSPKLGVIREINVSEYSDEVENDLVCSTSQDQMFAFDIYVSFFEVDYYLDDVIGEIEWAIAYRITEMGVMVANFHSPAEAIVSAFTDMEDRIQGRTRDKRKRNNVNWV